jgi:D-galactonate transporter
MTTAERPESEVHSRPARGGDATALEARAYRRVTLRLIPFLFVCYVAAYLDRVNVGFAKLQMLQDVGMSDAAYGAGAGIFFIGYFLCEVPGNVLLQRYGARRWISRIMLTWAVVSALTMFVTTAWQFFLARFLLGAAEAGFFPGMILYLTGWYPPSRRARIIALFMTATAVSGIVGGPLSGWIMRLMAGANGWAGWQWLYLLEAIPSLLLGIVVLFYLDDSISDARWLPEDERGLLQADLAKEQGGTEHSSLFATISDPRVLLLSALYFCIAMGNYGISFWLPQLIRTMGVEDAGTVGVLSALPYCVGVVAMVLLGRSSDRGRERRWHLIGCATVGALGLIAAGHYRTEVGLGMLAMCVATAGMISMSPIFWTLPTALLRGTSAAAGIAVVNSIGNLGGFAGPYLIGLVRDATGQATIGLYVLAAIAMLGAALAYRATGPSLVRRA